MALRRSLSFPFKVGVAATVAATHLITLTSLCGTAFAQSAPVIPDTVVLKDGGMIKGTLTEILPGDHATMQLSTGQTATIRWDVIGHIERNGAALQTTPAPTVPTTQPVVAAPPAPQGGAYVHLDADNDVRIEKQNGKQWISVCNAPCDRELPIDGIYRVAGDGVRNSHTFHLAASRPGERVVISASTASKGGFVGGIILTSIGGPVLLLGGLVLLVVAVADSIGQSDNSGAKAVGWTMFGLGAGGLVGGIVLMVNNASTSVEQFNEAGRPVKGAFLPGSDVWKRAPAWQSGEKALAPSSAGAGLPGSAASAGGVVVPIFTGHF